MSKRPAATAMVAIVALINANAAGAREFDTVKHVSHFASSPTPKAAVVAGTM